MDKIYEEKGKLLEKAFSELPLDVSLNMRGLSNLLNTTPEAIFCLAITQGMVKAWDYAGGDFEEAFQPIVVDAKCNNYISGEEKAILLLSSPHPCNVYVPILTMDKQKAFKGKEVTITIALKGGEE